MTYVLFEIGETTTKIALSGDLLTLDKVNSFPTPKTAGAGTKKIVEWVLSKSTQPPLAMAGGIRGMLLEDKSGIQNDVKLSGWIGKDITGELQKAFPVPIFLENDTALAGVGEAVHGAGKGLDIVAYHSVGLGVGGVKIESGEIDQASVGFEPGHQVLDIDRTILGDQITPTLENLISETAVFDRFGSRPSDIPQEDILWDELAEYLAQGLRNTILYWSPDVIVLGGTMIVGEPKIEIDKIRKYTVETLDRLVPCPFITKAKLAEEACLYGAMTVLKRQLK